MLDFDPKYRFTKRIEIDFNIDVDNTDGYNKTFEILHNKQFADDEKSLILLNN